MATIYDMFEVTSITANTTYSETAGNLLGVVDGMSSSALDDGEFDEGDVVVIGGVSYAITSIQEPDSSGRFTLGDGTDVSFDPRSESDLDVVFLTLSNGPETRYFIVPNDRYGDMNVQSIQTGAIGNVAGSDAAIISTVDDVVDVVCFAAGTRIDAPGGDIPVETIRAGDLVLTRDHGAQKVRAVFVRKLDFRVAPSRLKPIRFARGSLGPGRPDAPLSVSPQHRMLVTDQAGKAILVPAKSLTHRRGVRVMRGKRHVTYVHLILATHEILRANGALTESFFPGPMALKTLPEAARAELADIFGTGPAQMGAPRTAAPVLRLREARQRALTFR